VKTFPANGPRTSQEHRKIFQKQLIVQTKWHIYDLMLWVSIMKFSRAISSVRWFSFVETNVSKTISVLVFRVVTHISSTTLRTRTEMVFETLVSTKLNHLTRLIARENFIIKWHMATASSLDKSCNFCMKRTTKETIQYSKQCNYTRDEIQRWIFIVKCLFSLAR
jgi:hypothetical protein